jgi:hypothetical protein
MPTPIPTADPQAKSLDWAQARRIARSLNFRQATQLTAVYEHDLHTGWEDMRTNRALHERGLIRYITSPTSRYTGGGVWKTREAVTDIKITAAGRAVVEEWDILHAPGTYQGPELGTVQAEVLHELGAHHNGQWWPGCGWSWESSAQTIRVLDALTAKGLAKRYTASAGAPLFEITRMGELETREHWRKIREVRTAREARLGKVWKESVAREIESGHGCTWADLRWVDAMKELHFRDRFVTLPPGMQWSARADGSVFPVRPQQELHATVWTVRARIGETFTCESHEGRTKSQILRAGTHVLKVVTKEKHA